MCQATNPAGASTNDLRKPEFSTFRGWTSPRVGADAAKRCSDSTLVLLVLMLGLTGLCCGGFGLWSMRHPFGADTDLSSLAQALDLVVPTSLTPTLHSAYDTAQVRGRRWVSFARGGVSPR